jgi:hypothetical protein
MLIHCNKGKVSEQLAAEFVVVECNKAKLLFCYL